MKSSYTPGPWRADIDSIAGGVHEESMREFDASYKPEHQYWSVHAWRGNAGHYVAETGCHVESEANARLIAAAPELLEALQAARMAIRIEGLHGRDSAWLNLCVAMDAAIAKAKGES